MSTEGAATDVAGPVATTEANGSNVSVSKALIVGGPPGEGVVPRMRVEAPDEDARRITRAGAIPYPIDPVWIAARVTESTALRPAINALKNNVDSHGHRIEPIINLDGDDTRDYIKRAIALERMRGKGGWRAALSVRKSTKDFMPSEADVDYRISAIRARMDMEEMALSALFSIATPGSTFTEVRRRLRDDHSASGNGYLVMQRDATNDLACFEHAPYIQMYVRPLITTARGEPWYVRTKTPVRSTKITIDHVALPRCFRTYVQLGIRRDVFYKQFGCPLAVSARGGQAFRSSASMPERDREAVEVYHFANYSPLTVYGVPPWEAAAAVVSGVRDAQEVNARHFRNNAIPRMIVLVSGGSLKSGASDTLRNLIEGHAKGIENYGSVVILEAESQRVGMGMQRTVIEVKPLKEAVPDDALFQKYEAQGRDTILSQYGLPKFVIGLIEDVNRSTAREGLAFVEDQVYQPLRSAFDDHINAILFAEGIHYMRFVSQSPISRDPETMAKIAAELSRAGGLSANDVREVAAEAFNRPFPRSDHPSADLPFELAKLGFGGAGIAGSSVVDMSPGSTGAEAAKGRDKPPEIRPQDLADFLVRAEKALASKAVEASTAEIQTENGRVLAIAVSSDKMQELVAPAVQGSGA